MDENNMSRDFGKIKQKNLVRKNHVLQGTIKSIQPYGAFVEVAENVVGILHVEDISDSMISSPKDRYQIGDKIKVKVKSFDSHTGRIVFTTKELFGSWSENIKDFKEESIVKGIVRNKDKFGVFVELKPNLYGLAKTKKCVSYGDEVNVFIKKISPETKKVKLVIVD